MTSPIAAVGGTSRLAPPPDAHPLLHPVVLTAIAVLVANDHALKARWPGALTGKLSDVAGLVFFPVLLATLVRASGTSWQRVRHRGGSTLDPERPLPVGVAAIATGVVFATVKLVPTAAMAWSSGLGLVQWPARAAVASLAGDPLPGVVPVVVLADPWDLAALPALAIAVWIGRSSPPSAPRHHLGRARPGGRPTSRTGGEGQP